MIWDRKTAKGRTDVQVIARTELANETQREIDWDKPGQGTARGDAAGIAGAAHCPGQNRAPCLR
ncbi:MAG: hypothetical protein EBR34_08685 [Sphingomonadaceae bacterium]|nr:hypothetical protein [Sphingomonadaceae bacterium]